MWSPRLTADVPQGSLRTLALTHVVWLWPWGHFYLDVLITWCLDGIGNDSFILVCSPEFNELKPDRVLGHRVAPTWTSLSLILTSFASNTLTIHWNLWFQTARSRWDTSLVPTRCWASTVSESQMPHLSCQLVLYSPSWAQVHHNPLLMEFCSVHINLMGNLLNWFSRSVGSRGTEIQF